MSDLGKPLERKRKRRTREGDCFDTAAHYVIAADDPNVVLVHGTVLCTTEGGTAKVGQRHWHGWAERTEQVEFPATDDRPAVSFPFVTCINTATGSENELPQAYFYNVGRVEDVRRYTATEAAKMMVTTRHYGPWHDAPLHRPEDDQPEG